MYVKRVLSTPVFNQSFVGVSLSTLLFRARLTHGYSALPTAGTCPVPWGHLFYLPKECYSRSQRWRCRHSSAAERKQKKGSKIILKVMLWRHGIGVNFWPKCWSRGALNNQSLSVCGIPGLAGSWGRGTIQKIFYMGMQLRPREKTLETLRYQETSDYCYTTCTFLSALKLIKKKSPSAWWVLYRDFFEGDRAFLEWKNGAF